MKAQILLSLSVLCTFAAASIFGSQVVLDDKLKVPGDNPLYFCQATDNDQLQIDYVDLTPNPPVAGQPLTVKAAGNITTQIEDGAYVYLTVKWNRIRLIYQKEDLCAQMKNVDKECPLEKGETEITKDVELPNQIPPGSYDVVGDVYDKNDEKITCLQGAITFK